MRPLPRPIAHWADELAALSEEAGRLIGPWFPILERLRGSVSLPQMQADGEPDGFTGLSRRGPYARLVTTEWALLDDAPDEFVRRAGAGEHLFNELERAEKSGAGRIVVLFDAGPWQVGAPRLAHLAWLLILARHARSRSVHFGWGVLQSPDRELRESTDAGDIRWLMAARTREMVDAGMVAAWAERLGRAGKHEERWVVTHARDERIAARLEASTLTIVEEDDPLASTLPVDATARSAAKQRAVLALPLRRACGRLLRDPFRDEPPHGARPTSLPPALASGAQVVFSATSSHILARLASGAVVALLISPGEHGLRHVGTFKPREGTSVVAVGWRKKKMLVVTSDDVALRLHVSDRRGWPLPRSLGQVPGFPLPVTSLAALNGLFIDRAGANLWFCDDRWRLHSVDLNSMVARSAGDGVIAWGGLSARGEVAFVQRATSGVIEIRTASPRGMTSLSLRDADFRSSCGYVVPSAIGDGLSFVALGTGGRQWQIFSPPWTTPQTLVLPVDTPVYGAALVRERRCLLVRSSEPEQLEFLDGQTPIPSAVFRRQIEHACLDSSGRWIVAVVEGELVVINPRSGNYLRWRGPWP